MNNNDLNCYINCPFNDHGKDKGTGYPFMPCSDYHKETCEILKKNK